MADILVSDIVTSECGLSVWNQDESNCMMPLHPKHTMTLTIANGKHRKPGPWFYSIEFTSRKEWFKFVRLVNDVNRKIKKMPRDQHGFPMMDKWEG